jgi:CBS domain-containing protein
MVFRLAEVAVPQALFPATLRRINKREGGIDMKVGEITVEIASPDDTIQQVASRMAELDAGVLPVVENDRLVGMLTDRDIAIRAVAQGKGPDTKVREVMTSEVRYCFEDGGLDEVVHNMGESNLIPPSL